MLFPLPAPPQGSRRVVVTGAGIVTSLGLGWQANAEGFRSGRQAIRPVTRFDVSRQRSRIAGEVDLPAQLPPTRLPPRRIARLDRATRMLLHAAHEAWTTSAARSGERMPLVLGTTGGGMSLGEDYLEQALHRPHARHSQPTRVVNYQAQRQALDVRDAFGLTGSSLIIANACASGANAIGHAWEMVRRGDADQVLAGGYDAICRLIFAGFDSLQALSPTPCRPFDANRSGLTLGEGAGVVMLESLEHAAARDAIIRGELIGYAAATDTHHLTQPHPDGDAALATMRDACKVAGITPDQVDYINAHGTATPHNDSTEAAAINRWAGARAASLPVSSTKACIGHLLGAAGAVEAIVSLMVLEEQWLPPETSLVAPDPLCQFPIVREPTRAKVQVVLSNSFGFGGANASLVLRRWP